MEEIETILEEDKVEEITTLEENLQSYENKITVTSGFLTIAKGTVISNRKRNNIANKLYCWE